MATAVVFKFPNGRTTSNIRLGGVAVEFYPKGNEAEMKADIEAHMITYISLMCDEKPPEMCAINLLQWAVKAKKVPMMTFRAFRDRVTESEWLPNWKGN